MNYNKIIYFDTANARGLSTVLFVQGCTNNCKNCHNPETHNFSGGTPFTKEIENKIIESLKNPHIKNFVISGGDPCHPNNIKDVRQLCQKIKEENIDINIIVYTGYIIEELNKRTDFKELVPYIDILIDGPYIQELATKGIDYRGSINQRCWSCNNTLVDISKSYFNE